MRQTLLEDHRSRIENRPEGAQTKFDTLAGDVVSFFRGTALLYYRDHGGSDAHLPIVFTIGDVHPENFGVMPNSDGAQCHARLREGPLVEHFPVPPRQQPGDNPLAAEKSDDRPRGVPRRAHRPGDHRFRPSKKRVPQSSRVAEFQKVVDRYVQENTLGDIPRPESFFRVLDVARK